MMPWADTQKGDTPQLLERCRRGERAALQQVFEAEAPTLLRSIKRIVGPGGDAEDILENTLVAAIDAFPRYRGEASVQRWLTCIAVRVIRQQGRSNQRRRRAQLALVSITTDEPRPVPPPDTVSMERRRLERVYRILDDLDDKKRIAFVLHVFEGRPVDEVAAIMRASREGTKSRIFWARRTLLRRAKKDDVLRELIDEWRGEP